MQRTITVLFSALLLAGTSAAQFEAELPLRRSDGIRCALVLDPPNTCSSAWYRYELESRLIDPHDKYAFHCSDTGMWYTTVGGSGCKGSGNEPSGVDWGSLEAIWITPLHEEIERQVIEPCGDMIGEALNMEMGRAMRAVEDALGNFRESTFQTSLGKSRDERGAIYRVARSTCRRLANEAR